MGCSQMGNYRVQGWQGIAACLAAWKVNDIPTGIELCLNAVADDGADPLSGPWPQFFDQWRHCHTTKGSA